MAGTDKAFDKWKQRWRSKGKVLKGSIQEGALIDPIGATLRVGKGDERFSEEGSNQEAVDTLKQTSRPSNNALSMAMTPDIPEPEQQPIMPLPDEEARENEARRLRARRSRTGRQSTILTGLGG